MTTLRSLYTDPMRTLDVLREFIRQSDERQVIIEWFQNGLLNLVQKPQISGPVKVLGIGSGSGEVDRCMLQQLTKKYNRIYNRVLEPDNMQMNAYRKLIKTDPELENVVCDLRQQTSDQYLESCKNKKPCRFDVIHMIQVLYYVDDIEDTIVQLYENHLSLNGIMIIIHVSGSRAWGRFNKRYENSFPIFRHDNSTGRDIQTILDKHNIKFRHKILPSYLFIDECFKSSEIGSLVIDYITETYQTLSHVSDELLQDVFQYLKSPDCSYLRDNKRVFENDLDVFVVQKWESK